MADRVSIHYDDGSTVEAGSAADALFHLAVQGTAGVLGLFEDRPPNVPCEHCDGTGFKNVGSHDQAKQLVSREELIAKAIDVRDSDQLATVRKLGKVLDA